MNSRLRFVVCSSVLLLAAGCVGAPSSTSTATPSDPSPASSSTIQVNDITLERGESATLTIRATEVGELWFSEFPSSEGLTVELSMREITFRPPPTSQVDTYPPYWVWDDVESNVTMEVPVRAAGNATTRNHTFAISVANNTDHNHERSITEDVTVRVVN